MAFFLTSFLYLKHFPRGGYSPFSKLYLKKTKVAINRQTFCASPLVPYTAILDLWFFIAAYLYPHQIYHVHYPYSVFASTHFSVLNTYYLCATNPLSTTKVNHSPLSSFCSEILNVPVISTLTLTATHPFRAPITHYLSIYAH